MLTSHRRLFVGLDVDGNKMSGQPLRVTGIPCDFMAQLWLDLGNLLARLSGVFHVGSDKASGERHDIPGGGRKTWATYTPRIYGPMAQVLFRPVTSQGSEAECGAIVLGDATPPSDDAASVIACTSSRDISLSLLSVL